MPEDDRIVSGDLVDDEQDDERENSLRPQILTNILAKRRLRMSSKYTLKQLLRGKRH
ncbi:hypothetical protein JCM15457_869 [Liquorilactobacillus sucicola DSM 21376 = JCM 15457]|nr:hypothetical protein JCM15457_869 [Liquorilactobacillus sucicola DSM 21376 = JCM 15457]